MSTSPLPFSCMKTFESLDVISAIMLLDVISAIILLDVISTIILASDVRSVPFPEPTSRI